MLSIEKKATVPILITLGGGGLPRVKKVGLKSLKTLATTSWG
jgi:hypothetical protein